MSKEEETQQVAIEDEEDPQLQSGVPPEDEAEAQEAVAAPAKPELKVKTSTEPATPLQLKLDYERAKTLRKVLHIIKDLVSDEVTLKYNGNLNIKHMNTSRTAMVIATIDMGAGIQQLTEQPAVTRAFTVDIASILRVLKDGSTPTIDVGQAEIVVTKTGYNRVSKINLPLLEDPDEELPEPKVEQNINATVDFGDVIKELGNLVELPEALVLSAEKNALTFKAENEKLQKIEISGLKCEGADGKATYSLTLLKALGDDKWTTSYSADMPLKASRTLTEIINVGSGKGTTQKPVATITVWLAPRIETE